MFKEITASMKVPERIAETGDGLAIEIHISHCVDAVKN